MLGCVRNAKIDKKKQKYRNRKVKTKHVACVISVFEILTLTRSRKMQKNHQDYTNKMAECCHRLYVFFFWVKAAMRIKKIEMILFYRNWSNGLGIKSVKRSEENNISINVNFHSFCPVFWFNWEKTGWNNTGERKKQILNEHRTRTRQRSQKKCSNIKQNIFMIEAHTGY